MRGLTGATTCTSSQPKSSVRAMLHLTAGRELVNHSPAVKSAYRKQAVVFLSR